LTAVLRLLCRSESWVPKSWTVGEIQATETNLFSVKKCTILHKIKNQRYMWKELNIYSINRRINVYKIYGKSSFREWIMMASQNLQFNKNQSQASI
jgi:hypothetical protein